MLARLAEVAATAEAARAGSQAKGFIIAVQKDFTFKVSHSLSKFFKYFIGLHEILTHFYSIS